MLGDRATNRLPAVMPAARSLPPKPPLPPATASRLQLHAALGFARCTHARTPNPRSEDPHDEEPRIEKFEDLPLPGLGFTPEGTGVGSGRTPSFPIRASRIGPGHAWTPFRLRLSCTSRGIGRRGLGSLRKQFPCLGTMPGRSD